MQRTTGVLFGVFAPTPAVLSGVVVHDAARVLRGGDDEPADDVARLHRVRNQRALDASMVGSHPSPGPLPPMHGTSRLMSTMVPFGSVILNVPSENAQIVSESPAFFSVAR